MASAVCEIHLCDQNRTDLKGIHEEIGRIMHGSKPARAIHLCLHGNPVRSHAMGLLLIPRLSRVVLYHRDVPELVEVSKIISAHIARKGRPLGSYIIDAQHKLIEAGLVSYALADSAS